MAPLVTSAEVLEIIDTAVDQLDPFISMADLLVTENLADAGHSDARLKEIERWLAAHFIASSLDPRSKTEGVDTSNVTYEGQTGQGFAFTRYGQQAMTLDTSGTLRRLSDARTVKAEFDAA